MLSEKLGLYIREITRCEFLKPLFISMTFGGFCIAMSVVNLQFGLVFEVNFCRFHELYQVQTYIKRLVLERRTFKYVTSFCGTYWFFKIPKISIFSPDVRYGQAKNGFSKNYRRNSGFISENDMVETSVLSHYLLLYDFRLLLFQ